jgi:hypothetical protein
LWSSGGFCYICAMTTSIEISAAPGPSPDDRPPIGTVPHPGAAEPFDRIRPTVHERPLVRPVVWDVGDSSDFPLDHPYVRRYWVPVLGPGAIADLLRLATAAARGRPLPRPRHLADLGRAGLVRTERGVVMVRTGVAPVPERWRRRLPPRLRRELDADGRPRDPSSAAPSRHL